MDEIDYKRRGALKMLRSGQATLSEVAALAGVSRQRVRYWAKMADIDPPTERWMHLLKAWQKAVR